ncbi:metallophosphoesterase [Spirochaeta dissipatitropha]
MGEFLLHNMNNLFERTPPEPFPGKTPIVIFSDFHAGNGGRKDDFRFNAELTLAVLQEYYRRGYLLILNGDVEELQKFPLYSISSHWAKMYEIFNNFHEDGRLIRIVGNHDMQLLGENPLPTPVREAVRYKIGEDEIFIFHGHQASRRYVVYNDYVGFALKHLVRKLPFHFTSVSHDNRKRKRMESRIYEFTIQKRIVSIIGHTHRPLFESLSKSDFVKYNIERLCRLYSSAGPEEKTGIKAEIQDLKNHLEQLAADSTSDLGNIYHDSFVVPCMFNSGCVLGKRGITCIELDAEKISLKYWFDKTRSRKYLLYKEYQTENLPGTSYYETEIKTENLEYIFSRIHLLT